MCVYGSLTRTGSGVGQHLLPRLDVVAHVYRGARAVLFSEPEQPTAAD
jgi:hypothetical protein